MTVTTDHLTVLNPLTGEPVGEVRANTPEQVRTAVERAREAQQAWAQLPYRQRARIVIRAHDLILDRRDEIIALIQAETGKSRRDAFVEIFAVASEMRHYAYHGWRHIRPRRARPAIPLHDRVQVVRHPRGVVGLIAAWNFPFIFTAGDAVPALLAGNGVILKPSELTPLSALLTRDLYEEVGLPAGLLQVVNGHGSAVAPALIEAVDFVMFTGSDRVGRIIAQEAARHMTPFTLELGGKNPLIVLEDAHIPHAANAAAEGVFNNAGQVCINYERIYVHQAIYADFMAAVRERIQAIRLGAGDGFDTDMRALINPAHHQRVQDHIADALEKGAQPLSGGRPRPDLGPTLYEPTLLSGVTPEMSLHAEEVFGPVAAVHKVASAEEAIRLANDTPYGLHAGIFTRSRARGERLARQIRAGTVCINDTHTVWSAMDAPMGGVKASGMGRRHGPEGIQQYTDAQTIFVNRLNRQIGGGQTPLSIRAGFMDLLTWALKLWRRIPFLR